MRVALTREQADLAETVRHLLARECTPELVRKLQASDSLTEVKQLWDALAATGVFGLTVPEQMGGSEASLFELGLVFREAGRVLCPTIVYSTVALGLAVRRLATLEQQQHWLPAIAAGRTRGSVAVADAGDGSDVRPRLTAVRRDGGWSVSGRLSFVANADVADALLVTARTADGEPERFLAFLVTSDQPGVHCERQRTFSRDIQCRLEFDNVLVSTPTHVLGADGGIGEQDLRWVSNAITALQCMEMTGGSEAVLDRTVSYIKLRHQFGRPIASFQAAQHHIANMRIAIDGARLASYQAAWWVGRGDLAEREVAIAKLKCNEAYKRTTLDAHQLHGGMGYLRETDLHLWSERAKVTELLGGSWDVQIRRIEQALGLAG
jgi:alkylation response protein AidB-like acyl-CoA dehydrogenase